MNKVKPIGRVGQIADSFARAIKKVLKESDSERDKRPHHNGIAEYKTGFKQLIMRVCEFHFKTGEQVSGNYRE